MKKFLSVVLTITMVLGCILALSACTQPEEEQQPDPKPETNFRTAEENLIKNDYFVVISYHYNDDLDVGVEKVLKAYDLDDFIEYKTEDAEYWGERFDFEEWKESMGAAYTSTLEVWFMNNSSPELEIFVYSDAKMAEFELDRLQMQVDRANDLEDAYDEDSKNSDYYHRNQVYEEYEEKSAELTYKKYKYILENFYHDISNDEKKTYEDFIENYENQNTEFFGRDDRIIWVGTKAAIEATLGNEG